MYRVLGVLFLSWFGFIVPTAPLLAQTPVTATPTLPLPFNQVISSVLTDSHPRITYSFAIPAGQDVVIALESDKTVADFYCVRVTTPAESTSTEDCEPNQGGGGDAPTSIARVIPGSADPDAEQIVTLSIVRPLAGAAQYRLAAYPVTPEVLHLGETVHNAQTAAHPYHVYTFEANPTLPFTIEVEDLNPRSDFLWVAHQPYRPGTPAVSDERQPFPQWIDNAGRSTSASALKSLTLNYLGGQTFRLLVTASAGFDLYSTPLNITPLDANQTMPITVSYREPLKLVRLSSDAAGALALTVDLTQGDSAFLWIYTLEQGYPDTFTLGQSADSKTPLPRTRALELENSAAGRFVVVQLPSEYTRDSVTVEIEWALAA